MEEDEEEDNIFQDEFIVPHNSSKSSASGLTPVSVTKSDEQQKSPKFLEKQQIIDDFKADLKTENPTEIFTKFMNDFWDEYDTDGDGELDRVEFRQFLKDTYFEDENTADQNAKVEEKFDELFDDFDIDKNGVITKNEMFDFLSEMFGMDASKIDYERVMASKKDRDSKRPSID